MYCRYIFINNILLSVIFEHVKNITFVNMAVRINFMYRTVVNVYIVHWLLLVMLYSRHEKLHKIGLIVNMLMFIIYNIYMYI